MSNMEKPVLLFEDRGGLLLPKHLNKDALNFVSDLLKDSDGKTRLQTSIRATHSGQLIAERCYTGWGMKAGRKSWFSKDRGGDAAFDKPVLINHDMDGKPLGRVRSASFTQLKTGKDWEEDWIRPDTGLDLGSGYIVLDAEVLDRDAIEMVMDGRLNTVSTCQRAEDAWCSYCRTSVFKGCDHEIGSTVQDEGTGSSYPVFAVTGKLEYAEVSYVNKPRQQNAVTLSFKQIKDSMDDKKDVILDSTISYAYNALRIGLEDPATMISLLADALPSTGRTTGKKKISMSSSKKILGAPPGPVVPEGVVVPKDEAVVDAAPVEKPIEETKEIVKTRPENFDFAFSNLARVLKDQLDMTREYKDSLYFYGITDSEEGHAHSFYSAYSLKDKVLSGYTLSSGQGEPEYPHNHAIWEQLADIPMETVEGETREADVGPIHAHNFYASMSGGADTADKLVASGSDISRAISALDEIVKNDLLTDEEKKSCLISAGKVEDLTGWDEAYTNAARRLLPRVIGYGIKHQMVKKMSDAGHLKVEQMSINETLETAIKLLNDTLASTKKELEDAKAKLEALEADKAKLAKDNEDAIKVIKDSANSEVGRLVVALRDAVEGRAVDFSKISPDAKDTDPTAVKLEIEKLVSGLPEKMKTTVKSLVSDAKKDSSPVATPDKTNTKVEVKDSKSAAPRESQKSLKRLDELAL